MLMTAAEDLHAAIARDFEMDGAVEGPDPGVRFNYRIWRFLKGYAAWYPWKDGLYYLQCQGYWVMANWLLSQDASDRFASLALAACEQILDRQRDDGAWDYPNPEWKGRVATVEGTFATFALLDSYRRCGKQEYLDSALKWHAYFSEHIGFQTYQGLKAVNYFAGRPSNPVPNNSALIVRYLANLTEATSDNRYLEQCQPVISFLKKFQQSTGEFPYVVDDPRMRHFQCFQYHAFIYLDLWNYHELSGDEQALDIMRGIARFLQGGLSTEGYSYYECGQTYRTVHYHTSAIATALAATEKLGIENTDQEHCREQSQRAFRYFLDQQLPDGSFPHSRGDYRILCDHRKYPRYMAMMLYHMLFRTSLESSGETRKLAQATTPLSN